MEKISEMIDRMCPEGVERVRLGGTAEIGTGSGNRQDAVDCGSYPFFVRSKEVLSSNTYEFDEEAILIPGEGGIGEIFHYFKGKYALHQRTYRIHLKSKYIITKYLFYYLSANFKPYILRKAVASTATSIRKPMIEDFETPLPPLPIQQEIVRILDTFTQLQSNLEAELAARQKQYEYYRDNLFCEDVETLQKRTDCDIKTIGELGTIIRGKRFVRTDIVEEGVPCIHYGDMYTFYGLKAEKANTHITKEKAKSMRFAKKNDVVIVGAGENDWDIGVGLVWLGEEDAAIHDACYILNHEQNPMYISHFLRSTVYHLQLRKYVSSGKISSFSAKDLGRILIPIPSLQHQQEIVSILDTFESLITNLKQEIEARKKQYEYYREQLLTF
ncbi:MAG: restriction endonuclease subunit S [Bacteroidaceae bacterium]|nr:restriction endonuclease subunit S [Bacteroidaceae bacterium]